MPWLQFLSIIVQASIALLILFCLLGYLAFQISYNWYDGINRAEAKRRSKAQIK